MATVKLTAQQKRDREYMQLTAELTAKHEQELITACNQHYTLGLSQGDYEALQGVYEMSLWQRITYRKWFRKLFCN